MPPQIHSAAASIFLNYIPKKINYGYWFKIPASHAPPLLPYTFLLLPSFYFASPSASSPSGESSAEAGPPLLTRIVLTFESM